MKRQQTVYVCDICGRESTQKFDVCDICGKDYCNSCSGNINLHVSTDSKKTGVTIAENHKLCADCGQEIDIVKSIAIDLIKGKDFSEKEFKVGK